MGNKYIDKSQYSSGSNKYINKAKEYSEQFGDRGQSVEEEMIRPTPVPKKTVLNKLDKEFTRLSTDYGNITQSIGKELARPKNERGGKIGPADRNILNKAIDVNESFVAGLSKFYSGAMDTTKELYQGAKGRIKILAEDYEAGRQKSFEKRKNQWKKSGLDQEFIDKKVKQLEVQQSQAGLPEMTAKKIIEIKGMVDKPIEDALNSVPARKAIDYIARNSENIPVKTWAKMESWLDEDLTYEEAYEAFKIDMHDPNNGALKKFVYQLQNSGTQATAGIVISAAVGIATKKPNLAMAVGSSYWTALSADEQIQERGYVYDLDKIIIDVALDNAIGNRLTKLGMTGGLKDGILLSGLQEGGTEITQTWAKYAVDYAKADSEEERAAIRKEMRTYLSDDMLMEFAVAGVTGSTSHVIMNAIAKGQTNQLANVDDKDPDKELDTRSPEEKAIDMEDLNREELIAQRNSIMKLVNEGNKSPEITKVLDEINERLSVLETTEIPNAHPPKTGEVTEKTEIPKTINVTLPRGTERKPAEVQPETVEIATPDLSEKRKTAGPATSFEVGETVLNKEGEKVKILEFATDSKTGEPVVIVKGGQYRKPTQLSATESVYREIIPTETTKEVETLPIKSEKVSSLGFGDVTEIKESTKVFRGDTTGVNQTEEVFGKTITFGNDQHDIINAWGNKGDEKAIGIANGPDFYVHADRYIKEIFGKEFDTISYKNEHLPQKGTEYMNLKSGKFYSNNEETAKVYASQAKGREIKERTGNEKTEPETQEENYKFVSRYLDKTVKKDTVKPTKKQIYEKQTNKGFDTNIGDETDKGGISEPIPVGEKQSVDTREDVVLDDKKELERRPVKSTDRDAKLRDGPRSNKLIVKGEKARLDVNSKAEEIIREKRRQGSDIYDPATYSENEKVILKEYSGYGGIRNRQDDTSGALDEFYTPPKLTRYVYQELIDTMGVERMAKIKNIIEPAVGTGNFIYYSPFANDKFTGFEINKNSAVVASVINEGARIRRVGNNLEDFSDQFIKQNVGNQKVEPYADLVVGNPPYGKYEGYNKGLGEGKQFKTFEEYFIARGLAVLKDGGYLAYIVSSNFMRGKETAGKLDIGKIGEFVSAKRFPNGVFADTNVGTDLVIFRKNKKETPDVSMISEDKYFTENPEFILGEQGERQGRFGMEKFVSGTSENIPDINLSDFEHLTSEQAKVKKEEPVKREVKKIAKPVDAKILKKVLTILSNKKMETVSLPNPDLSKTEIRGYTQTQADGSIDREYSNSLTDTQKEKYFSYHEGKWFLDQTYLDNVNLYTRLTALENAKDIISSDQYNKQKKLLENSLPTWTTLEEINVAPQSPFWEDILAGERDSSIKELFLRFTRELPQEAFEGLFKNEVSNFTTGQSQRLSKDDPRKDYVAKNVSRVTNNLFQEFKKELIKDQKAKEMIEVSYNKVLNAFADIDHTNVPITVKISKTFKGRLFELNPAQRKAIGFILRRGKGIAALDVGVGKTITGIISALESFERGTAKRSLIVVPNSNIGQQWIDTIKELTPEINIYNLMEKKNVAKMKGHSIMEKSFVIVTEEGMKNIALTKDSINSLMPEFKEIFISDDGKTPAEREEALQTIYKTIGVSQLGTNISIEELGIDHFVVDEAHNYNHIIASVPSKREKRTYGSSKKKANPYQSLKMNQSQRGIKMFVLGKYILHNNRNRNVVLLTATPFTNNPLEIYSLLSLVGKSELSEMGVTGVREFIETYMHLENERVVKPSLTIGDAMVVKKFTNFDSFRQLLGRSMIKIDGEDAGVIRPNRIDKDIYVESTQRQFNISVDLSEQYIKVNELLKNTSNKDAKKKLLGTRMKVMGAMVRNPFSQYATNYYTGPKPTYKQFVNNTPKLRAIAISIKETMKTDQNANSIVYSALRGNTKLGIDYLSYFKQYLAEDLGIPEEQILIIEGKTKKPQRVLYKKQFNSGKARILIGTNAILEGLDLQTKTTDVYVATPFWNFTAFRQLAGRAWRQGNMWENVRIHRVMAKNTGDTFITQKISQKEKRDTQIKSALKRGDRVTEIGGDELAFDEVLENLLTDPVQIVQIKKDLESKDTQSLISSLSMVVRRQKNLLEGVYEKEYKQDIKDAKDALEYNTKALKEEKPKLKFEKDTALDIVKARVDKYRVEIRKANVKIKESEQGIENIAGIIKSEKITKEGIEKTEADILEKKKSADTFESRYKKLEAKAHIDKKEMIIEPTDFLAIKKNMVEENKKSLKKAPTIKGSVGASVGMFNNEIPVETSSLDTIFPMELPELVEYAKQLQAGIHIGGLKTSSGLFKGGNIKLNPVLFKDIPTATKTLAHEVGHLIDWLPNKNIRRGNLLGRVFTLRKYLKNTFGETEVTNKEFREELWNLSQEWRPVEPNATESFLKYRKSASELYADALSVLLNNPGLLEEKAPLFYSQFFNSLSTKPEVETEFYKMQELLGKPRYEIMEDRERRMLDSFRGAANKNREIKLTRQEHEKKIGKTYLQDLKTKLYSINSEIYGKVKKKQAEGLFINPEDNPIYVLQERNYLSSKIKNQIEKYIEPIKLDLEAHNINWSSLGQLLLLERITKGDRSEIANPHGLSPESAQEQLDHLKAKLGDVNWKVLQDNSKKFRNFAKNVTLKAKEAGLYSDALFEKMDKNEAYAPFRVVEHLEETLQWNVMSQIGTFKGVDNPADAYILKLISTMRATHRNTTTSKIVNFLQKEYGDEITAADTKDYQNKFGAIIKEPVESKRKGENLITYYKDGKVVGHYVDHYIAMSVKNDTVGSNLAVMSLLKPLKFLNSKIFRPVFVVYNVGWIPFNLMRDFFRFYKNTAEMTFTKAIIAYGNSARVARIRAFGVKTDKKTGLIKKEDLEAKALLREMEQNMALNTLTFNDLIRGEESQDEQIEEILRDVGLGKPLEPRRTKIGKLYEKTLMPILDFISSVGDFTETLPKAAAYQELKGTGDIKEVASFVRTSAGSPDFFEKGYVTPVTNEVFLFMNPMVQGIISDYHIAKNPKTRSGFLWKTAKVNILPKIIMFAIAQGLAGDWWKERMDDVSEYDKTNYTIVPTGISDSGKTTYIRIPTDETGRTIGGLIWKSFGVVSGEKDLKSLSREIASIFDYAGGQAPSVSPAIDLPIKTYGYLTGKNPYDAFRGRNVLSDDVFDANDINTDRQFLGWLFQSAGGSILWKFNPAEITPTYEGTGEKILKLPLISNVVGRWIKVSDYGQVERAETLKRPAIQEAARRRNKEKRIINDKIGEMLKAKNGAMNVKKYIDEAVSEILGEGSTKAERSRIKRKFKLYQLRGASGSQVDSLLYGSNSEKAVILKGYRKEMSEEKWDKFYKEVKDMGIISKDVIKKLNE